MDPKRAHRVATSARGDIWGIAASEGRPPRSPASAHALTCKWRLAYGVTVGDVFRALADPTRRLIVDELSERDGQTLFELCARLSMRHGVASTRQAISQHLDVLEEAGLRARPPRRPLQVPPPRHGAACGRRREVAPSAPQQGDIVRIRFTSIFVDDQEGALRFYTDVLGFESKADIPLGEGVRWLTVVSPQDPDGPELVLEPASHPAVGPFKEALLADGIPFTAFAVDDLAAEVDRLKGLGVRFTQESAGPWPGDHGGAGGRVRQPRPVRRGEADAGGRRSLTGRCRDGPARPQARRGLRPPRAPAYSRHAPSSRHPGRHSRDPFAARGPHPPHADALVGDGCAGRGAQRRARGSRTTASTSRRSTSRRRARSSRAPPWPGSRRSRPTSAVGARSRSRRATRARRTRGRRARPACR